MNITFAQFLKEARRMSREKNWNPQSMFYAPGQNAGTNRTADGKDAGPNKSVLDYKISQHKVTASDRKHQAAKAKDAAEEKRKKYSSSPATLDLEAKAKKLTHQAKRQTQAAEAGERVKSDTERKLAPRSGRQTSASPDATTSREGSPKKSLWARLRG